MHSEARLWYWLHIWVVVISYGGVSIKEAVGRAISKAVEQGQAGSDRTLFKGSLGVALSGWLGCLLGTNPKNGPRKACI